MSEFGFTDYCFIYEGKKVKWSYKEQDPGQRFISCSHEIFIKRFNSPTLLIDSLEALFEKIDFESPEYEFFLKMRESFMNKSFWE